MNDGRCYAVVEFVGSDFSQIIDVWDSMTDAYAAENKYNEEAKAPFLHYLVWPTFYGGTPSS